MTPDNLDLTLAEAVDRAVEAARETGIRQAIYYHPLVGWTWMEK